MEDIQQREGVTHLRVEGKGEKTRYIPLHVTAQRLIAVYLGQAGHKAELSGPLFRPVKNNRTGTLARPLIPNSVYVLVKKYAKETGIADDIPRRLGAHAMRTTAATNALQHEAEIAKGGRRRDRGRKKTFRRRFRAVDWDRLKTNL